MTAPDHARALDGVTAALIGPEHLDRTRRLQLAEATKRASAYLDTLSPQSPAEATELHGGEP